MNNLLLSLGLVLALELVSFFLLYKLTRWKGSRVAFTVIVTTLFVTMPWLIINWQGIDRAAIHIALYIMLPYVLGIITSNQESRRAEGAVNEKWFHWAPATLVGFFLVLLTVDSTIIHLAENGFPGTVSHDFQEKEALYNDYLEKRHKQKQQNWTVKKGWLETVRRGDKSIFQIEVNDKQGTPVNGATLSGEFLRPSDSSLDQVFEMSEVSVGRYQAELIMPVSGEWQLVMTIGKGGAWHEVRASTRVK